MKICIIKTSIIYIQILPTSLVTTRQVNTNMNTSSVEQLAAFYELLLVLIECEIARRKAELKEKEKIVKSCFAAAGIDCTDLNAIATNYKKLDLPCNKFVTKKDQDQVFPGIRAHLANPNDVKFKRFTAMAKEANNIIQEHSVTLGHIEAVVNAKINIKAANAPTAAVSKSNGATLEAQSVAHFIQQLEMRGIDAQLIDCANPQLGVSDYYVLTGASIKYVIEGKSSSRELDLVCAHGCFDKINGKLTFTGEIIAVGECKNNLDYTSALLKIASQIDSLANICINEPVLSMGKKLVCVFTNQFTDRDMYFMFLRECNKTTGSTIVVSEFFNVSTNIKWLNISSIACQAIGKPDTDTFASESYDRVRTTLQNTGDIQVVYVPQ